MKNKVLMLIYILLIAIFIIFVALIINDSKEPKAKKLSVAEKVKKNSVFDFDENVNVNNFKFIKEEYSYLVSFDLILNTKSDKKYNLYLLDKDKNLLYTFYDIVLESEIGEIKPHKFHISYDISKLDKLVILEETKKLDYNKDISDTLTYIGNTVTNQNSNITLPMSGY